MLQVFQSNRLGDLATLLAGRLSRRETELFSPELIVVQHPSVGRWLSLFLSDQLGICANTQFPLPAAFIWQQLQSLLGELPEQDGYQVAKLQWHIFDLLSKRKLKNCTTHLSNYLDNSTDLDRYELSGEIARCFDRYLVYRPDWIRTWQAGNSVINGDAWQAELWRLLVERIGNRHWVDLQSRLGDAISQNRVHTQSLPDHVSVFAPTVLSPSYLDLLQTIAKWMDVDLYLLNPSEEHWIDLATPKQLSQRQLEGGGQSLYLEVGNPILASLGVQRRDFFSQLLNLETVSVEGFVKPQGQGVLKQLQRDIFTIADPATRGTVRYQNSDRTFQVHTCHSPMREVEVLRDQLLEILNSHPDIGPDDIAVMTPDMNTYAPLIEAVFGESDGAAYVPFNISDQPESVTQQGSHALSTLLALPGSRFGVEEVIALLEIPLVSRNFGIDQADLPRVIDWVEMSGIRWGLDDLHRGDHGQPETRKNSWSLGVDRLLLGYAMPGEAVSLLDDVLPVTDLEGSESQLLGGLCDFVRALKDANEVLQGERPWKEWEKLIGEIVRRFLFADDAEDAALWLHGQLSEVFQPIESAQVMQVISFSLLRDLISNQIDAALSTSRFMGGGVTFCAFAPLRALPFKVTCLIGMNEQSFPRREMPISFDLMSDYYRLGDRSKRGDDQSLFLETLITVQDILYISYVGNSIKDNSEIPPSVVVGDLLDYLDTALVSESGQLPSQHLVTKHPLQAFNYRYFDQSSALFSYSKGNCQGAVKLCSDDHELMDFIDQPLNEPEAQWKQISLEQLLEFYQNPTRYLLRRRLGILLVPGEKILESRDPFQLGYFDRSDLFLRIMNALETDSDLDTIISQELSRGNLSHGKVGQAELSQIVRQTLKIRDQIQQYAPLIESAWVSHQFIHGELHLQGEQQIYSEGVLGSSIHPLSAAATLQQWIRHLALNLEASEESVIPSTSVWFEPERRIVFRPAAHAADRLGDFLDYYWLGLQLPLQFFPKSSLAYAKNIYAGKDRDVALSDALKIWQGGYAVAESSNAYYQRAYPNGIELGQSFCELSETLLLPMLEHMEGG